MYQQGYRPPQGEQSQEKQSVKEAWNAFSPAKRAAIILLLFLLLLFCGFVLNPTVGAFVFMGELVAGAVIGIRAVKRSKQRKPKQTASNAPKTLQSIPKAQQPPLRDGITDLGYGHSVSEDSEYIRGIHVAGVTYKNGRRHRQTILRQIYWRDDPYNAEVTVRLHETEYEGSPAIEVWTNDEQIGYVPKNIVPFIIERFDRAREVYDFEVSGGGKTADGSPISYGASFSIAFNR